MRAIILSVSGLALTACSMAGGNPKAYAPVAACSLNPCAAAYRTAQPIHPAYAQTPQPQAGYTHHSYGQPTYVRTGYRPAGHPVPIHGAGYKPHGQLAHIAAPHKSGHVYGTLGANMYDIDRDLYGVQGRVGYQSADIFGAEVEGSIGLNDEDPNVPFFSNIRLGVDWQTAAFARAVLPLSGRFNVFARGGYHYTQSSSDLSPTDPAVQFTFKDDGFAYGAGAEYNLTPRDGIRLDYTRYELGGGRNPYDSASIGYIRRF